MLVGIAGRSGVGKDWLYREVFKPRGWHRYGFSWPLKAEGLGQGFTIPELYGRDRPEAAVRWMQQRGAEEGWMKYGTDYWLKIAEGWLYVLREEYGAPNIAITDVRFKHEADWILAQGGKLVLLESDRPSFAPAHRSEPRWHAGTRAWDCVLDNGVAAQLTASDAARKLIAAQVL